MPVLLVLLTLAVTTAPFFFSLRHLLHACTVSFAPLSRRSLCSVHIATILQAVRQPRCMLSLLRAIVIVAVT